MIGDLLGHDTFPWGVVLPVLLIFGFAPRLVLRIAVLAFHRDDPRRAEMLAELHAVPRAQRPLWVMEQLEVALSEGLWERIVWAATGRIIYRWSLRSGVESHRKYPETFWIPDDEEKAELCPGVCVKLMFTMRDGWAERMWVNVVKVKGNRLVGTLANNPLSIPRLSHGDEVKFRREHVIDIDWLDEDTEVEVIAQQQHSQLGDEVRVKGAGRLSAELDQSGAKPDESDAELDEGDAGATATTSSSLDISHHSI